MYTISLAHWLVIISGLISLSGAIVYIKNILRAKTKPNLVSWSMWALAPLIGTGAALSAGGDVWATVRIFLAGFVPVMIIVFALFKKQSYWKLGRFDYGCGLLSLLALLAWLAADMAKTAILLAAVSDGFAALPTILKAWKYPETETGTAYISGLIAVLLVIPSMPNWSIENSAFQIYLIIANTILIFAVYRRRLKFALTAKAN